MSNLIKKSPYVLIKNTASDSIPVNVNLVNTNTSIIQAINANKVINRFLDTVGDGTGTKDAVGDYSSASTSFKISPASGEVYRIIGVYIFISDNGEMEKRKGYGSKNKSLTNGIQIKVTNSSTTLLDITNGMPIKNNIDWFRFKCLANDIKENNILTLFLEFLNSGLGIALDRTNNEKLEFILNDKFSFLNSQTFYAIGQKD